MVYALLERPYSADCGKSRHIRVVKSPPTAESVVTESRRRSQTLCAARRETTYTRRKGERDLSDTHDRDQQHNALIRKILQLRLSAIAARGSARALDDQRSLLHDERRRLTAERDNAEACRRQSEPEGKGRWMAEVQRNTRALQAIETIMFPEVTRRIAEAETLANSFGQTAQAMLREAETDIHYMGVAHAL
jgi:hypothetical protein